MDKKMILLTVLFPFLFWHALGGGFTPRTTSDQNSAGFKGALNIRIHSNTEVLYPPAEMLLIDPQKRKAGSDPRKQASFFEIPDSSYESESIEDAVSGTPGPVTKILDIRDPMNGVYVLKILGTEKGRYSLELRGTDSNMEFSHVKFTGIEIENNEEHLFSIAFFSENSGGFKVTSPFHIKIGRRLLPNLKPDYSSSPLR